MKIIGQQFEVKRSVCVNLDLQTRYIDIVNYMSPKTTGYVRPEVYSLGFVCMCV